MIIDRVARAMTAGAPRSGFTARVMAPIHGRPSPDFTARVMERVGVTQPVARAFRPGGAGLILIPAALALIAGVVVLRSARGVTIPAPPPPRIAAVQPNAPVIITPAVPREITRKASGAARPEAAAPIEASPIYTIAALEGPADIAMKSIEPAACTIPALDAPAPLKVSDLPGTGGGSQKEAKEKS